MPSVSQPFRVNQAGVEFQGKVQLAVLTSGAIVAVWETHDPVHGPGRSIAGQIFSHEGVRIGSEFKVNMDRALKPGEAEDSVAKPWGQYDPVVTALGDGGFVVAYMDGRSSFAAPYAESRDAALRTVLTAQRFDADGRKVGADNIINPVLVAETGSLQAYATKDVSIVGLSDNGFAVTYAEQRPWDLRSFSSDLDGGIILNVYSDTNGTSAFGLADRQALKVINTSLAGKQIAPMSVAALDAAGNATDRIISVWQTESFTPDASPYGVQFRARFVDPNGPQTTQEIIIPRSDRIEAGTALYDVAALPGGGFIIVWSQRPNNAQYAAGVRDDIQFQIVAADGSLAGPIGLAHASDGLTQASPTVAVQADGTILIAWQSGGYLEPTSVQGRLFTAGGSPLGEVFEIAGASNKLTASKNPEAAATLAGTFMVAFEDNSRSLASQAHDLAAVIVDPDSSTRPPVTPSPGDGFAFIAATGSPRITEGNSGTTMVSFTFHSGAPITEKTVLTYQVTPYSQNGADPVETEDMGYGTRPYLMPYRGTVTFEPGNFDANQTVFELPVIPVQGDTIAEPSEFFEVRLVGLTGGLGFTNSSVLYEIADDDGGITPPPTPGAPIAVFFKDGPQRVSEATGPVNTVLSYEVALERAATTAQTVRWSVADNSANGPNFASGADFAGGVLPGGTIIFQPGQTSATITIDLINDALTELGERFIIVLDASSAPALSISTASRPAGGIFFTDIVDDDQPAGVATATPQGDIMVGTDQAETLDGGGGDDSLSGGGGPDLLIGGAGSDWGDGGADADFFDGGAGIDRGRIAATSTQVAVTTNGIEATATVSTTGETDSFRNVERLAVSDGTIVLDIALPGQGGSNSGSAYRLYEAAFNRTPDSGGLAFWIRSLDGGTSVRDVAQGFVGSLEFRSVYGTDPTAEQLINGFYNNILGRAPEAAGFAFWFGLLDGRPDMRSYVLEGIANSPENQQQLIATIGQGVFVPGEII